MSLRIYWKQSAICLIVTISVGDASKAQKSRIDPAKKAAIDELRNSTDVIRHREGMQIHFKSKLDVENTQLRELKKVQEKAQLSTQIEIAKKSLGLSGLVGVTGRMRAGVKSDNDAGEIRDAIESFTQNHSPIADFKTFSIAKTKEQQLQRLHAINVARLESYTRTTDIFYMERDIRLRQAKANGYLPESFQPTDFRKPDPCSDGARASFDGQCGTGLDRALLGRWSSPDHPCSQPIVITENEISGFGEGSHGICKMSKLTPVRYPYVWRQQVACAGFNSERLQYNFKPGGTDTLALTICSQSCQPSVPLNRCR